MMNRVVTLMPVIGLLVFLALPELAFADNGGDHADGWPATAAAALAAASGGGLAALIGGWLNRQFSPPPEPPPPPPPDPEVPKTAYPQNNAYEPGGLSNRN